MIDCVGNPSTPKVYEVNSFAPEMRKLTSADVVGLKYNYSESRHSWVGREHSLRLKMRIPEGCIDILKKSDRYLAHSM